MDRSERLIKSTLVFAVGTFGSKVLVMLVIPFCTHYVDTVGMGTYDLIYTASELLKTVAVLCIPEALFRWIVEQTGGYEDMLSTWVLLFLMLIAVFSAAYWGVWLALRFQDALILYAMIVTGALYLGVQFGVRGVHRNKLFAAQGILYAAIMCTLSFLFVIPFSMGYQGLLLAILLATVAAIVFCVLKTTEFRGIRLDLARFEDMRKMLRYAVPLIPNQVSWWCITSLGRLAIVGFLGVAANGIYAVASKFPSAVTMLSSIFQQAWQEQAVLEYSASDRDLFFTRVFGVLARGLSSALLVLLPATAVFILLFTEADYHSAKNLTSVLYVGALFSAFSSFYGTLYMCSVKTEGAASTTIVGAVVAAALNFTLVMPLGLLGIGVAVAVSQLVVWVVRVFQTRKYAVIVVRWRELLLILAAVCAEIVAVYNTNSVGPLVALSLLGGVAFVVLNRALVVKAISMAKGRQ
ncbi:lipopolysaccharide biosynthesis protein [Thermophilibacter sp.]